MTLSANPYKLSFLGSGVVTPYPITFYFIQDTDLAVHDVLNATGALTPLVLSVDYTLTGAGNMGGGTLNRIAATAVGHTLTVERSMALDQPVHFVDGDPLPAEDLEEALDRTVMLIQQQQTQLDRTLSLPQGTLGVSPSIPTPVPGYALGVNATGTEFIFVANTGVDQAVDLADTTLATKGAGRVGYNSALSYAAGTVGKFLTNLMSSIGTTFIGHLASLAGAVFTTQKEINGRRICIFDFMTPAQIADVTSYTGSIDLTNVFATAHSVANRQVHYPAGNYLGNLKIMYEGNSIIGDGPDVTIFTQKKITACSFQASFAGNVMTILSIFSGALEPGQRVIGTNLPPGTIIMAQIDATHYSLFNSPGTIGSTACTSTIPILWIDGTVTGASRQILGGVFSGFTLYGSAPTTDARPHPSGHDPLGNGQGTGLQIHALTPYVVANASFRDIYIRNVAVGKDIICTAANEVYCLTFSNVQTFNTTEIAARTAGFYNAWTGLGLAYVMKGEALRDSGWNNIYNMVACEGACTIIGQNNIINGLAIEGVYATDAPGGANAVMRIPGGGNTVNGLVITSVTNAQYGYGVQVLGAQTQLNNVRFVGSYAPNAPLVLGANSSGVIKNFQCDLPVITPLESSSASADILNWEIGGVQNIWKGYVSWNPAIVGSTGTIGSYASSVAVGTAFRSGNVVHFQGRLVLTNKGAWTGTATLTGLPVTSSALTNNYSAVSLSYDNITLSAGSQLTAFVAPNSTSITLGQCGSGIAEVDLLMTGIASNTTLMFAGSYQK